MPEHDGRNGRPLTLRCPACERNRQGRAQRETNDVIAAYAEAMLRREPPPFDPELYGAMIRERWLRQQAMIRRVPPQEARPDE